MPNFSDGFASQADMDRRLRELSERIDQRALANPDVGVNVRAGGTPPTPSGLTLVSNPAPGTFTVKWSPVLISDLRRYEIEVADNNAFTGSTTFSSRQASFTYDEGQPLVTYFVRVRVINNSSNPSGWSSSLNTTTGQANSGDLAAGAAVNWARTVVSVFNPSVIKNAAGGTPTGDYGDTLLTTKGGIVVFFAQSETDYVLSSGDTAFVEILMDNVVAGSFPTAQSSFSATAGTSSVGGSGIIAPPSPGSHSFKLRVRLIPTTSGGSILTPQRLTLAIVELGREGL